jgi:hypothetical protein
MKGQAAIEFLTTYAWGVLVVLLTIGAMFYFGILGTDTTNNKCELWPEFACEESKVNADGTIQLQIRNNLGDMSNVEVSMTTIDCTLLTGPQSQPIAEGKRWDDAGDQIIQFDCAETLTPGDIFEAEITVEYQPRYGELNHTKEGYLRRAVE